jgi:hypothetical protein
MGTCLLSGISELASGRSQPCERSTTRSVLAAVAVLLAVASCSSDSSSDLVIANQAGFGGAGDGSSDSRGVVADDGRDALADDRPEDRLEVGFGDSTVDGSEVGGGGGAGDGGSVDELKELRDSARKRYDETVAAIAPSSLWRRSIRRTWSAMTTRRRRNPSRLRLWGRSRTCARR